MEIGVQENRKQCWGNRRRGSRKQQGKYITGKCEWSQVLFRVVNRRPDDECQRACGTYGSADEGLQVRVIRTPVIVIL